MTNPPGNSNRGLHHHTKHPPKLTPKQVLSMRKRVKGGDLGGKSVKAIGHDRAYRVGSGEAAMALAGIGRYADYPETDKITDRDFLLNAVPGSYIEPEQRTMFIQEDSAVENEIIARAVEETQDVPAEELSGVAPFKRATDKSQGNPLQIPPSEIETIRLGWLHGLTVDRLHERHLLHKSTVYRIIYATGRWSHLPSLAGLRGKANAETLAMVKPAVNVAPPVAEPEAEIMNVSEEPVVLTPMPMSLPGGVSADELLRAMLEKVGPGTLGWVQVPPKNLMPILKDMRAAYEMMAESLAALETWAEEFEQAQTGAQ